MAKNRAAMGREREDQTRRLKEIAGIPAVMQRALQSLDIVRADQLTGVASNPRVRDALMRHLDVSGDQIDKAVTAASETMSVAQSQKGGAAADAQPARSFPLGALRPPPQVQAAALSIPLSSTRAIRAPLPTSTNLVAKMSPIRDQGNRGTCVAFCLTAIHEFATRTKLDDFSERYLYYRAKLVDGSPGDCGTTQDAASKALISSGQCRESIWEYNPGAACNNHGPLPADADADAAKHKQSLTAHNPHDVVAIKTALAQDRPVGISIPVYNSWYQSPTTVRTGRITMPIGGEPDAGGHCMCIVGYQDDGANTVTETPGGGFFILRNSWSTDWGKDCQFGAGYGTIPYAYIAAFNWEAYTLPKAAKHKSSRKRTTKHAKKKSSSKSVRKRR